MAKTIHVSLNSQSIRDAIRELREYKKEIKRKAELLRQQIALEIGVAAESKFKSAVVDDLLSAPARMANVSVTVEDNGRASVVIANGTDAVWVEFGAGVYHNGGESMIGKSPHERGSDLGFTIGSMGEKGKKNVWGFYEGEGDDKTLILTHGTPASMPMYNSMMEVCDRISEIAREVFG